ncbi:MAG: response regulator, partial [Candidatus Cloacimonetes bacterium]|nr:response regulator [Candidatus Cloacimonadota bacterium]
MKKKILIVDDEPLIRDFIANFFYTTREYENCRIDIAVNGEEAIAKIRETNYDLIFTDLQMPGKSGLDVIRFASENSPETDTVLLTAYGGGESAAEAMSYGAYEYI